MKVILKARIPNLGHEWDIVTVKNGYARNFLLPQNLAGPASAKMIKMAEERQKERLKKMEEVTANAKEIAEKLKKAELSFTQKAKAGKLYGSIAEKDIMEALKKEYKVEVSKEMVGMDSPLKTTGSHKVKLQLAEGVSTEITVKISEEK